MPSVYSVERWSFIASLLLVFASGVAGQTIDQAWQPYGPSTVIEWAQAVALLGGLVLVGSFAVGTASERARSRSRPTVP
jgi:hypothetical protein